MGNYQKVKFIIEVELIPELGLRTAGDAQDALEEMIRDSGMEEMLHLKQPEEPVVYDSDWTGPHHD